MNKISIKLLNRRVGLSGTPDILLCNKCLEKETMYIPRKFQNDKVYTMNVQEKNIYHKLALQKLNAEMEILTNRLEHFRNNLMSKGYQSLTGHLGEKNR